MIPRVLEGFAEAVTEKTQAPAMGAPEAQLHGPISRLLQEIGEALGERLTVQAESRTPGRLGIPDFAILKDRLLVGYVETKAPGTGADATRYSKGHNLRQWRRFKDLPNILYTDGNEWALFQDGERVGRVVRLEGDVTQDGSDAIGPDDPAALQALLEKFFAWEVIAPSSAKHLAELLAPVCRILRDEVLDALSDSKSPLVRLANEWREHLFPEASDSRFADAYAQTVTYALLLAKAEDADVIDIRNASDALQADHSLLARALQVMTDPKAEEEIRPALRLVKRIVAGVRPEILTGDGEDDPWIYFYEDFLAAYDPALRKDAGVYYTPIPVVRAQVRLVDHLLTDWLNMPMGLAEGGKVVVLDPAVGTGTYLLGVIDHAMSRVAEEEGPGSVRAQATLLAQNIHGFEFLVGPYAVAELRLTQSIVSHGGNLPGGGPPVYLTNTLESPHIQPPAPPLFYEPIAQEHRRALQIKEREPIMVCIGNPPYDRHEAGTSENRARTGAWVRWGDDGKGANAPLNDYIEPAKKAGHGGDLKSLYNLYVYFWRWAFWKVFDHETSVGPGIVTYISASSYLNGDAFSGMREHMRRTCDHLWIIDLGGEGRGTRKDDNVFAIQTPVAIAVALRTTRESDKEAPAAVRYSRIEGNQESKLSQLDKIHSFEDLEWQECSEDWQAPFIPPGQGAFFEWPSLTRLMPWQQSGVKVGRTWPIASEAPVLRERWAALLSEAASERADLFVDRATGRKAHDAPKRLPPGTDRHRPITALVEGEEEPSVRRYGYRSFDRQYLLADGRLIDRPGPPLWEVYSEGQIYFTTLLNQPLGSGPAMTCAAEIPDLHHFRGSYGGKEVIPLYRDREQARPNLLPGLLQLLGEAYHTPVHLHDFVGYVYGVLAQPAYTEQFEDELSNRERVNPKAS